LSSRDEEEIRAGKKPVEIFLHGAEGGRIAAALSSPFSERMGAGDGREMLLYLQPASEPAIRGERGGNFFLAEGKNHLVR